MEGVGGFARLEEHVWVLGGASEDGTVRIEAARSVIGNEVVVDEGVERCGGQ